MNDLLSRIFVKVCHIAAAAHQLPFLRKITVPKVIKKSLQAQEAMLAVDCNGYEQRLERLYTHLGIDGKAVVDIGASLGRHTIPLAKLVGEGGLVMAFEPLPSIRAALCSRLLTANLNNVATLPIALSSKSGSSNFVYTPEAPAESGLKRRETYNSSPTKFVDIPVVVRRLDEVVPSNDHIAFIKIDVEGAELDVLKGAENIIRKSRPMIAFESGAAA